MMRSSTYNRFGVLMGTSARASSSRWLSLREGSLPMITLISLQGDFCATAHTLFEELLRAMRRPALGAGRARRPTRIYLDNAEDVAALTPLLEALNIQCVSRHTLSMADEVMVEMETQMGK